MTDDEANDILLALALASAHATEPAHHVALAPYWRSVGMEGRARYAERIAEMMEAGRNGL